MIALFIPCLVDAVYPEVGEAMVAVLARLGLPVTYPPDQTCCGQPAFNAGYLPEARVAAKRFIKIFESADVIVCPSGSCTAMVRRHYPALLKADENWSRRARRVGEKIFEFSEYLVDVLGKEDLGARYAGTVTYHDSCHLLRSLGIHDQPRRLISRVAGARFVELHDSDRCCGFGGAFSVTYPEISTALVAEKVANILASGADTVIGADMGCLMNIEGRLSRMGSSVRVMHIAQLLSAAQS
jgi:L-lactate dehydrogenase complex protein LldE